VDEKVQLVKTMAKEDKLLPIPEEKVILIKNKMF